MSEDSAPTSYDQERVPFTVSDNIGQSTTDDNFRETVMPQKEVLIALNHMYRLWMVTTDAHKQTLFNDMLLYVGINSPSPRGGYSGVFTIGGREYQRRVIYEVLQDSARKFFRFYADETRKVFVANKSKVMPSALEKGFPSSHYDLSFDYASYCSGLTQNDRSILKQVKAAVLSTTSAYNIVKTGYARKPKEAHGEATGTGSAADNEVPLY